MAHQYEVRDEAERALEPADDLPSSRSEPKSTQGTRRQRSRSRSKVTRPQGSEESSEEENRHNKGRGQLSRSGELARLFAEATKDVRHELKRPPANANILDQYLASPRSRPPLSSHN